VVFGSEIPTSLFQSVNPLFIMLLAPVFSWMWMKLRANGKEPSTPMKFVLGLVQLGLGFGMIVLGAFVFAAEGYMPLVFLILMYLFHTTGELSLSPIGLSMVTKLSPGKIVGFVMGAWFLSISLAHELAGQLGKMAAVPSESGGATESLMAFTNVYLVWGVGVILGASILLLILVPTLKKWMHDIH
jgi:proton-dependent oligopeptide transporter, POT family